MEQIVDVQVEEELVEVSKVFPQDKVQQRFVEQTIETPAISLAVKIVEVLVIRTKEKTQQVVNTHVQHVVNTVEVEKPKIIKETVQSKKPIIQEQINQVTKRIEVPQVQFLDKADDMPVVVQRQVSMAQKMQRFHRCKLLRRQLRSHSCRKPLRPQRSRRSRALRPSKIWALRLPASWHRRKLWRRSRPERFFLQIPHHPCCRVCATRSCYGVRGASVRGHVWTCCSCCRDHNGANSLPNCDSAGLDAEALSAASGYDAGIGGVGRKIRVGLSTSPAY